MKVLVTGCHGFVGTHLTQALRAAGHEVWGCDLQHNADEYPFAMAGDVDAIGYVRADISDRWQLERALAVSQPEIVFHAGAEFGRHNGVAFAKQLWNTNVLGTTYLLDFQRQDRFKLVFFSTSEVYGNWPVHMSEDVMDLHEVRQLGDYALSKWVGECQVKNSIAQHQTESVIVRLFNVYGPHEAYSPYRSALCRFIYCALKGIPMTVYQGHRRSWLYIDDLVRTLVGIPERFKSGEVYNLGNPTDLSMEELAETVVRVTGADRALIQYAAREPQTTLVKRVDVSKAQYDLGHMITVPMKEGIARTAAWMRDHYNL